MFSVLINPGKFEKDTHFGERFWKATFSVTENAGSVWTVGLTGEKKMRFQIYLGQCGRGLI